MTELIVLDRPCPHCAPAGQLRRRKTVGALEHALRLITPCRPFKCDTCGRERWYYVGMSGAKAIGLAGLIVLVVAVAYAVAQVIVR